MKTRNVATLVAALLLAGCQGMYAGMGPMAVVNPGVDNSRIPWKVEVGGWVTNRCKVQVAHVSTVRGGWPLYQGKDNISFDTVGAMCYVGRNK